MQSVLKKTAESLHLLAIFLGKNNCIIRVVFFRSRIILIIKELMNKLTIFDTLEISFVKFQILEIVEEILIFISKKFIKLNNEAYYILSFVALLKRLTKENIESVMVLTIELKSFKV